MPLWVACWSCFANILHILLHIPSHLWACWATSIFDLLAKWSFWSPDVHILENRGERVSGCVDVVLPQWPLVSHPCTTHHRSSLVYVHWPIVSRPSSLVDILDWLVPSLLGIWSVARMGSFLPAFLLQRPCLVVWLCWRCPFCPCHTLVILIMHQPFHSFFLVYAVFQSHTLRVRVLPLPLAAISFGVASSTVSWDGLNI